VSEMSTMWTLSILAMIVGVAGAVATDTWVRRRWNEYVIWPAASWLMVWGTLIIMAAATI